MNSLVPQNDSLVLSHRFRQRLRELSVPVVRLSSDGGVATEDDREQPGVWLGGQDALARDR